MKIFWKFFYLMFAAASTAQSTCITSEHLNESHPILDNDSGTCDRLDIAQGVTSVKLEKEPSCVDTTQVEFLAILEDFVPCSNLSILFVNKSAEICPTRSRCPGVHISSNSDTAMSTTSCLFKCPRRQMATIDRKYEIHMLYTNYETTVNLCDLKIRHGLCSSNPCQHEGNCTDELSSYACQCIPRYTGDNCETNIDECASTPCENDSPCSDTLGPDSGAIPCKNGGTCVDGIGFFTCQCPPGYTGKSCESSTSICASDPCFNGGICNDYFDYYYLCDCQDYFYGFNCEYNTNVCGTNPCQHGGTCINTGSDFYTYTCSCLSGYTGDNCEDIVASCPYSRNWIPPNEWIHEDKPAFYIDFEDNNCITFYKGSHTIQNGRNGRGIHTDGIDDWISLGDLSHITCITSPETCPTDEFPGATILLWVKIYQCPQHGGILSSYRKPGSNGISIVCEGSGLTYTLIANNEVMIFDGPVTYDKWIHTAMVYEGPGNGMHVFLDGNYVGGTFPEYLAELQGAPCRELMIGRFLARQNAILAGYTNVDLDELLIWNRILDEEEIAVVVQMADNV